jgi:hypothetical protein
MRKSLSMAFLATLVLLVGALPARAQLVWDAPLLVAPSSPAGVGIYLVDPHPGSGIGVMTTFRATRAPGVGYRLGFAEYPRRGASGGRIGVFGGVDLSGPLLSASDDFPLDLIWVTGVGLGVGDRVRLNAPLGVSLGRVLEAEGISFNPYIAPRVDLDADFGSDAELRLALVVDLGVDLGLQPGWVIRFGASLGDHRALAIGLSFQPF